MSEILIVTEPESLVIENGEALVVEELQVEVIELTGDTFVELVETTEFLETPGEALVETQTSTELLEVGIQGPPGPQGPAGYGGLLLDSRTNEDPQPLKAGHAVYASSAIGCALAIATDANKSKVLGFAPSALLQGNAGQIQLDSVMELTPSEWEDATGIPGALAINQPYYLGDSVPGGITPFAPTQAGSFICPVGIAISPTKLLIEVQPRIKL